MLEEMGYSSTISERPEKLWLRCMQVAGTGPQSKFSKNVRKDADGFCFTLRRPAWSVTGYIYYTYICNTYML